MSGWTFLSGTDTDSDGDGWLPTDLVADLDVHPPEGSDSVSYHLELAGVEGDSRSLPHRGEVTVLAWSWDLSHTPNPDDPHGRGSLDVGGVTIVKPVDRATPRLTAACADGLSIPRGTLTASSHEGGRSTDYFAIELAGVRVASVDLAGLPGNHPPAERVELDVRQVTVRYGDEEYQVGQ